MQVQSNGLSERTDDVLFAFVTRGTFHAIAIFDHSVFKTGVNGGRMTAERERMWKLHEKHTTLGMAPGTFYMANPIMSSGHPFFLVRMCDYYTKIIVENDPKLDDRAFVNLLYQQGGLPAPSKFSLEWQFNDLDLGVLDKKTNVFFSFHQGHI